MTTVNDPSSIVNCKILAIHFKHNKNLKPPGYLVNKPLQSLTFNFWGVCARACHWCTHAFTDRIMFQLEHIIIQQNEWISTKQTFTRIIQLVTYL